MEQDETIQVVMEAQRNDPNIRSCSELSSHQSSRPCSWIWYCMKKVLDFWEQLNHYILHDHTVNKQPPSQGQP